MAKLRIETVDDGSRVVVSLTTRYDAETMTRFHVPRPSSRPPPFTTSPIDVPRPPRLPRMQ